MRALLLIFGGALLAQPVSAAKIKANYRCDDGTRLIATFKTPASGPGSLTLKFPSSGKKIVLPQKMSADGGRYAAKSVQFWVKGQKATLTRRGHDTICRTKS